MRNTLLAASLVTYMMKTAGFTSILEQLLSAKSTSLALRRPDAYDEIADLGKSRGGGLSFWEAAAVCRRNGECLLGLWNPPMGGGDEAGDDRGAQYSTERGLVLNPADKHLRRPLEAMMFVVISGHDLGVGRASSERLG